MESYSPFDKHLLAQFKTGLRNQQRELQRVVEEVGKQVRGFAESGPLDVVDTSCDHFAKESLVARSSQSRNQLRLVELALERIQNSNFGTCVACGDSIDLKRLQAIPWTSHCIQCQERVEHSELEGSASSPQPIAGLMMSFRG